MYQRHGDARDAIIPIHCTEKHTNLIIHAYPIRHNWQQTCLGKENKSLCPLSDCLLFFPGQLRSDPSILKRTLALHSGQFASPSDRHQTGTFLPLRRQPRPHVSGMSGHKGESYLETLRSPPPASVFFRIIPISSASTSDTKLRKHQHFWSDNTNGGLVLLSLPTAFCVTGGVCRGFRLAWGDLVVIGGNFPVHDRVLQVMQTPPDNKKGVHCTETGDGRGNEGGILGPQRAGRKYQNPFFILPQKYPTMTED